MVSVDFLTYIAASLAGALFVQICAFAYSVRVKRVDVVDIAWGPSFIGGFVALQLYHPSANVVAVMVGAMVLAWGARLSWHIYRRFIRSAKQDERYTKIMASWPKQNQVAQSFYRIFLVQAVLATIIGLPVVVIYYYAPAYSILTALGLVVWLAGFATEVVADRQLKDFLQQPNRPDLMTSGLWRYSRHPNYFGEVTMWWGIAFIACATPLWWLGLLGAATITFFIRFVSGVPPAEARATTKSGWSEYKRKTSVLVPLPPKN